MIDASYCSAMAEYNQWMNERLYSVCASLPDSERKMDKSAFFGSVHRTLNHILYGDLAFMSRFTGNPSIVPEFGVDLHDEFQDLWEARSTLDARILDWAQSVPEKWLGEQLTYESKVDGITRTVPRWILVTHMFNHETHHRGQVTTLLSQMGVDMGTTDIPFMPKFQQS
ncbi:MAG: DinB family protein [Anderseniella sp.]